MTAFIRKSDLSRDRAEQRPERFAVGDRVDAQVTNIDKAARQISAVDQGAGNGRGEGRHRAFGSSDSGASLGDILGAALSKAKAKGDTPGRE